MDAKSRAAFIKSISAQADAAQGAASEADDAGVAAVVDAAADVAADSKEPAPFQAVTAAEPEAFPTVIPVAADEVICPVCKERNKAMARFCKGCGAKLAGAVSASASDASESAVSMPVERHQQPLRAQEPQDADDGDLMAFARGIPGWDLTPPNVMVRRKASKPASGGVSGR